MYVQYTYLFAMLVFSSMCMSLFCVKCMYGYLALVYTKRNLQCIILIFQEVQQFPYLTFPLIGNVTLIYTKHAVGLYIYSNSFRQQAFFMNNS